MVYLAHRIKQWLIFFSNYWKVGCTNYLWIGERKGCWKGKVIYQKQITFFVYCCLYILRLLHTLCCINIDIQSVHPKNVQMYWICQEQERKMGV
jgi:hypothetical protein